MRCALLDFQDQGGIVEERSSERMNFRIREAITAVFPEAIVQTCIVHLLRNSLDFVSWKDRKGLATALKEDYRTPRAQAAEHALTAFEASPLGVR